VIYSLLFHPALCLGEEKSFEDLKLILDKAIEQGYDGFPTLTYAPFPSSEVWPKLQKYYIEKIERERTPKSIAATLSLITSIRTSIVKWHRKKFQSAEEKEFSKRVVPGYLKSKDVSVQKAAVYYLGKTYDSENLALIQETLDSTQVPELKAFCLLASYEVTLKEEFLKKLRILTQTLPKNGDTRREIANDLAEKAHPDSVQIVANQILEDPHLYSVQKLLRKVPEGFTDPLYLQASLERVQRMKIEDQKGSFNMSVLESFVISLIRQIDIKPENEGAYLKVIKPYLLSENTQTAYLAQILFDKITATKGSLKNQSEFAKSYALVPKHSENICTSICSIADKVGEWLKPEFIYRAEFDKSNSDTTWYFAVQSLSMLFISKAAEFCESARDFQSQVLSQWLSPKVLDTVDKKTESKEDSQQKIRQIQEMAATLDPDTRKNLEEYINKMRNSLDEGKRPLQASVVYGVAFYSLWLQEVLSQGNLPSEIKSSARKALGNSNEILMRVSKHFKGMSRDFDGDSLFNTYAIASVLMALESPTKTMLDNLD